MNINLVTDAPKHNLALMRISTELQWVHGHAVHLNGVGVFDATIGSWLFDFSDKVPCDREGGPGVDPSLRLDEAECQRPDYDLFSLDFSLGYTWEYCPRKCPFCVIPKQNPPDEHHSIWAFHESQFKKICLLNNNTFSDPDWRETFEEIWDADLTVIDENGYDLRLLDDEKAEALKKTRFRKGMIHFAWDQMKDERKILAGMEVLKKYKLNRHNSMVYVLIGYNTTEDEDFYRLQKIHDFNMSPYVMPYTKNNRHLYAIKRFIDQRAYRRSPSIKDAWNTYKYKQ